MVLAIMVKSAARLLRMARSKALERASNKSSFPPDLAEI